MKILLILLFISGPVFAISGKFDCYDVFDSTKKILNVDIIDSKITRMVYFESYFTNPKIVCKMGKIITCSKDDLSLEIRWITAKENKHGVIVSYGFGTYDVIPKLKDVICEKVK